MSLLTTIPLLLTPGVYVEFDASRANGGLYAQSHRVLLIGQRLAAGSLAAGQPAQILSSSQADAYFGRSSMLAAMCRAARSQDQYLELWAIALDDVVGSVKAAGTLTLSGPATAAGTLRLMIAGQRVPVAVASGATAASMATAVAAAINAIDTLPITAAVDGTVAAQVNITARHGGEVGNCIDVRVNYYQGEQLPAGVGIAIVCPEDGATNPDLADAFAALGETQYHTIGQCYTDSANLSTLESELADRWDGLRADDGFAVTSLPGTLSSVNTLALSRNSAFVSLMGSQASPTPAYEITAQLAALRARSILEDPALPVQSTRFEDVLPPSVSDRWSRPERNSLLTSGSATSLVDGSGSVAVERLVTTYKTNPQGIADTAYRDSEVVAILSAIRYDLRAYIATTFPRYKLAPDTQPIPAGAKIMTPSALRGYIIARAYLWLDAGWITDIEQFKADLMVQINETDPNRADVRLSPNLINQLRVTAAQIQFGV